THFPDPTLFRSPSALPGPPNGGTWSIPARGCSRPGSTSSCSCPGAGPSISRTPSLRADPRRPADSLFAGDPMPLAVAVQMDPIETINPLGDSTFALMLEAQERGHRVDYYLPRSLAL